MSSNTDSNDGTGKKVYSLNDLIYLMQRLRDKQDGCPWDLEQSYESIVPSTLEEAYELVDAIERQDYTALREELGDYLFQAVFYSQLASEKALFDLNEVISTLVGKLIRRHPHVFPMGTLESRASDSLDSESAVSAQWEEIKQEERHQKGLQGVLDDVPRCFPALTRAQKLQKRASKVGFDWAVAEPVYEKIEEEIRELREAVASADRLAIEEEVGDLLFSCVNLARHLNIDSESALRRTGHKFEDRFKAMERIHAAQESGGNFSDLSPEQMEALWVEAKMIIKKMKT